MNKAKLLTLFVFCALSTVSASAQITLKLQRVTVQEAIAAINQNANYSIVVNSNDVDLAKRVNVDVKDASIQQVLDQVFAGQNVSYSIEGKRVSVNKQSGRTPSRIKVSGKVLDPYGVPVIGAGVIESGNKSNGAVSDIDGNFSLVVAPDANLNISCIGYTDMTVPVNGRADIQIVLVEDAIQLEESVVMGYGTQRKKLITGSTVNVTGDKIAATNAVDVFGALQSQAAGVNITSNSGQPGESYKITIRGLGTIGDSEPLYVIDGVPGGSIKSLSPNDIESVDVLKDAASSAIYGARAANGVILVTTKQGKAGKINVSYDGYVGFQNANTNGVTPLNAKQYMEIINKAYEIQGTEGYDFASLIPLQYADIMSGKWEGTNWLEESLIRNAPIVNQSVNITGGSDISRFAMGFSYFKQDGTIGYPANPNYDRYTARINSDYSLLRRNGRDILKFGENLTFTMTNKSGIAIGNNYGNSIRDILVACPILPAYNAEGGFYEYNDMVADNWDFNQDFSNPLARTYYNYGNNNNRGHRIQSNFYLEFRPIEGLTIKSSAGLNFNHSESRSYVPSYVLSANNSNDTDDVSQRQSYSARWSWENTANYVKSWGDHNFDFLLGQSIEKWGYGNSVSVKNSNSLFPGSYDHAYIVNTQGLDVANTTIGGEPYSQGALSSFFGRVNYNYKETYMLSAVLRADGSSNFKRGNRWGIFPSVSAGWVITNEPWMADTKSWLSFLKFRGSWGQNGNCNISNFQYLATIAFDAPYYFNDKDLPTTGAYPDILPNENVKWETSEQVDFGLDARFFKSRLGISFDWYDKMTKDWLVVAPTLLSYGTGAPYINGGDIRNRGYEILATWNDNVGDLSYGASFTFSHNSNVVTRLANSEGIIHGGSNVLAQNTDELYRVEVGYPIGYFWGYEVEGIIQNESDLQNYIDANCDGNVANSLQGASLQPGDCKFVDKNEDGKITKLDKTMIGDPNPDYNIGLSFNLSWKGIDFAVNGYGALGQQIAKSYRHFSNKPDENYTTDVYTKWWTGEGSTNRYPRFSDGKNTNMSEVSSIWIEDGSYFKISNITLGYDFNRLFKWKACQRIRAYVSAQNMLTFTKYSGMDPEIGYGDGQGWMSGVDVGNYPSSRAWIFGLNIAF